MEGAELAANGECVHHINGILDRTAAICPGPKTPDAIRRQNQRGENPSPSGRGSAEGLFFPKGLRTHVPVFPGFSKSRQGDARRPARDAGPDHAERPVGISNVLPLFIENKTLI